MLTLPCQNDKAHHRNSNPCIQVSGQQRKTGWWDAAFDQFSF